MSMARFAVRPSGAALGADIEGFPFTEFTCDDIAGVRAAWHEHLVLRFRDCDLDDPAQIRFSAEFGPPVVHPRQLQQGAHAGHKEILVVSNLLNPDGSAAGDLGDGDVNWHTDTWFRERPPAGSFLRAIRLPPDAGNTQFLNMYRAYETLPAALKSMVAGRKIHHQTVYDGRGDVRMGMTVPDNDDPATWPGVDHPIVRTLPSVSRSCLFLGGRRCASVVGLPRDESEALIDALWAHATNDGFTWTQIWREGDLVAWDNRCTMHRRDRFDPATIRLMHRTTAEGERPV